MLNTNLLNQADAQKTCNAEGGHLASWTDMDQQGMAESVFTDMVRAWPMHSMNSWMASCGML